MKYRYAVILFFVAFILQTTLLNTIAIFGITPNLILCLVIVFSFLYEDGYYGIVLGVVFGLLYDICFSQYAGIAALDYLIIGFSIMLANAIMNKENMLSIILVAAGATCGYNLIYWVIMAMAGSNYGFLYMLKKLPFYMIYNVVIVAVLYSVFISRVVRYHRDRYYQ